MLILGLNAYHGDSSACLVRDGELVAAAEEERFRRVKHWAGFPAQAIAYCLSEGGVHIEDLDIVAVNQDAGASFWRRLAYVATRRPSVALMRERIRNRRQRIGVAADFKKAFPGTRLAAALRPVEHHLAHLGSAFLVSPFEEAVAVSVDGFGDFASAAWGVGRGATIEVEGKVHFPHSLGIFYQALTQYLGFPAYGDEYKVMGLAPYGQPRFMREMRRIVGLESGGSFRLDLGFFRHHLEGAQGERREGEPMFRTLFSMQLADLLGPARRPGDELLQRHKDIACSVQGMYEEALFHLLNRLHARHRIDSLAIAGGCGMNSVANGKVYRNTPFKRVYVPPAAGDAGGAIGAAFVEWHRLPGSAGARRFEMDHAYWGPQASSADLSVALEQRSADLAAAGCTVRHVTREAELVGEVAQAIDEGKVVGWFQGRMEWGPRALGNRSILCDPRRADMKDILNLKIKRRESFRPFAPSVLREAVPDWFECDDDVPFMGQVFPIRAAKQALVPAVTHVDGTGRLQTVTREANSRYFALIQAFRERTGIPMVLNTSFNENEPVVCRPGEALDCFLRTNMDVLVLGDWLLMRPAAPDDTIG